MQDLQLGVTDSLKQTGMVNANSQIAQRKEAFSIDVELADEPTSLPSSQGVGEGPQAEAGPSTGGSMNSSIRWHYVDWGFTVEM